MLSWPRSNLGQFAVIAAACGCLLLGLFLYRGFRCGWRFPINPYRERYFYDGSAVHTTDWTVRGAADVDGDGRNDLVVTSVFDPVTEECRESAWILTGSTGKGILRLLGGPPGERSEYALGTVGGCCDLSPDSIRDPRDGRPAIALSSVGHGRSVGAVFLLDLHGRTVLRVLEGRGERDDFGWSFSEVGDLDGDGVLDHVGASRGLDRWGGSIATAFSGATGAKLWTTVPPPPSPPPPPWPGREWIDRLCGLGDVDGDGTPDVALSRPGASSGRGSVEVVSGRNGGLLGVVEGESGSEAGMPDSAIGDPLERIADREGELLVGSLTLPSRILSVPSWSWTSLPRPLYRAREAGDVDGDGTQDWIGSERHYWDPEEIVLASGKDGRVLHRFHPEPGYRFLSDWRTVGDQDGDAREDLGVVSDNELPSGWLSYSWSPGFGAITVYSGRDGSVVRRIDRSTLIAAARAGIPEWVVK